ncbi:MAG: HEAT repeat domain-containing protein [Anaerolineales bacterium]|nr:HEAT repeat domain-containing protein [Anaerolineales bacterium]
MLELTEALLGGANLVICGEPGAGKSFALAHLACQIIRKTPGAQALPPTVPVLIHFGEVEFPPREGATPTDSLIQAVSVIAGSIKPRRFPKLFRAWLQHGRVLLLLDGLDELSPPQLEQAALFLKSLLDENPGLRVVTTAHAQNLGRLPALGFQVTPLAAWDRARRAFFITRWSNIWLRYVADEANRNSPADPLMLIGWLLYDSVRLSPLELTFKVWSAFAGDSLGPGALASIEAYLRRMTVNQPAKNRLGLEQLAAQMTLAMEPLAERRKAESWLGGSEAVALEPGEEPEAKRTDKLAPAAAAPAKVRARGALPDLIDAGLVVERAGERISIAHPALTAYLASRRLSALNAAPQLAAQPEWCGRSASLGFIAALDGQSRWMEALFKTEQEDLLQRGLIIAGRWLRKAPESQPWTGALLRQIALVLQKNHLPFSLRARLLYGLAQTDNSGVPALLRQLLGDAQPAIRQLAALGLGYLRDAKSIEPLSQMVSDRSPGAARSALLALVAIGQKASLETVAYTLLHGEESLQKAAAEALANDLEEGQPTLKEASELEDARVRRAVVYGLGRVKQPWAVEILAKLAAEDKQWVVQDAANQVLQTIQNVHPRVPRPLPALPQTAWLIAFAGARGMGVAPGKPAYEMLRKAVQDGDEDQRVAAIYYLGWMADANAILPIYQIYFSSQGEVRETAYSALWNMAACGAALPPPSQFGLG